MAFEASTDRGSIRIEGGSDRAGLSPMDCLLGSVAACMGIDVVEILGRMCADVTGYEVVCEGWRREATPRSYQRLRLLHRVRGRVDMASAERAVKLSQEKYCSAMASLDPGMRIENVVEILPG